MIVKVSSYRDSIDHLFRVVNVDYHACVNAGELRNWVSIAERLLAEVSGLECKRANEYDRDQHRQSLEAASARLAQAQERIERVESITAPIIVSQKYKTMTDAELQNELDFLVYENNRIGRGHEGEVFKALLQVRKEIAERN